MPRPQPDHDQCYQVKIGDDEWVHIPGCWGAIEDPAFCTCHITGSELERAKRGRREAEMYIEKMRDRNHERVERLNQMFHTNRKLHAEVRRLEEILAKQTA